MTGDQPSIPYAAAEIHIAMLRLPGVREDFAIEDVLDAFGYWTLQLAVAGEREKVEGSLRCLEKLVESCPPHLARQAVTSMFRDEDWHSDGQVSIGPRTCAILETQDWWLGDLGRLGSDGQVFKKP